MPAYETRPAPPHVDAVRAAVQAGADPFTWFRFGEGYLALRSGDAEFAARFESLHQECRCAAPPPAEPCVVRLTVAAVDDGARVEVHFDDREPLDAAAFARAALADLTPQELGRPAAGERTLGFAQRPGVLRFRDSSIIADRESPWPGLAAALALHRVLRRQSEMLFFHASSVAIAGHGVLIMGAKGAGKTTLALALADRGHALYGDEIAGLRQGTLMLVPMRRRLSIRPGPTSPGVARLLAIHAFDEVELADGTRRIRPQPADLFPGPPPGPVPARAVFFVRSRGATARATLFRPGLGDVGLLAPFESMTWGTSAGAHAFGLLRLLSRLQCYRLEPGSVADTAALIEARLLEG